LLNIAEHCHEIGHQAGQLCGLTVGEGPSASGFATGVGNGEEGPRDGS
jgi:hypothetical protein